MLVGEVFARMGLDSKQFEKDLSRLEGVTRREATTLGAVFKNAFSVALGIGVSEAVKRGFQAIASTSISFNAQMEQARIGFTTMLGSAERAEAFLSDMAEFAAKTPFEFPELLDASKRMLAYGFAAEDVLPTMEAVGNASAAVGLGTEGINRIILALGQMRAKGKLSAEEMRQLTETGIPAWEILAEAMNKTTAEIMDMQSKGLIPADRAIKMLVEGMNKRFPDMMKNMENTWEGVTSTIKDVWRMTIGAVTQNLFQGVVSWLQKVRDFAVGFYDTFQKYGLQRAISESFGPEVAAMVSVLGATLRGLASVVSAVTGFITQYGKQIRFVAVVMGTYLVLLKTVTLAKWLATVATTALTNSQLLLAGQSSATTGIIGFLSNVITFYKVQMLTASATTNVFTGALVRLQAALYAVWTALGPVGWAIIALSLAVAGGMTLWNKYSQSVYSGAKVHDELVKVTDQVEGSVGGATGAIEDEADALKKAGKAAGKNLQSFDEVHQLQDDMAGSAEDLAKSMGLDDTELGVPGAGGFEIPDIGAQLEEMKPTLAGFWEWIKQGAGNLWETVKQKWSEFVNWVKSWDVWDWISTTAVTVWTWLSGFLSTLWQGIVSVAQTVWGVVGPFFGALWEGVKTVFSAVWGVIQQVATTVWTFLVGTAQAIWGVLGPFFETLWGVVKEVFSVAWNAIQYAAVFVWTFLVETAKAIWDVLGPFFTALWEGIKAVFEWVWNTLGPWLVSAWNWLVEKGQAIWDFLKPYFEALWKAVTTIFEIIIKPLIDWVVKIWDWVKEHTLAVWNAIKEHIVDPVAAAKKDVEDLITKIKEFVSEKWTAIKEFALDVWQRIKEHIVDPILAAKDKVEEYMGNLKKSVEDIWGKVKDAVKEIKDKIYEYLIEPFQKAYDFIKDTWGKITGFFKGSGDEGKSATAGAAEKMMEGAEDYLAFHSPTRKGPGRYADKWAPNLMKMYAEGLNQNIPKVRNAVDEVAQQLTGMTVQPQSIVPAIVPATTTTGDSGLADTVAQAVYQAIMDAIRISRASSSQSSDAKELVLKIDNTVLARMQLPALTREAQRQGFDLVLRPQGV